MEFDTWLSARDAWNGLPLWKINLGMPDDVLALGSEAFGPPVADDNRVYTAHGEGVIAVDAATGRIVATLRTKHVPLA